MSANRQRLAVLAGAPANAIFNERVPEDFLFTREPGQLAKMVDNPWRKIMFEPGQKLLANSCAEPAHIAIRRILAPGLPAATEVFAQFETVRGEKRPHDGAGDRVNRSQPGQAGSPNQVRQKRFRLIFCCMRHGNAGGLSFAHHARKKCISKTPRRILESPVMPGSFRGDIFAGGNKFMPAPARQVANKPRVFLRFRAAKSMIKMNDDQCDPQISAEPFEQSQERNRIAPARYRDAHAPSRFHHSGFTDVFKNSLFERVSHSRALQALEMSL